MRLNLPVLEELTACRSLLIAGMGGGFDVYCGLPIYFELRRLGVNVHLASLTFTQLQHARNTVALSPNLVGVTADTRSVLIYFPELHLARWLRESRGEEATIWCFQAEGARPLLDAYRTLADRLQLDGVLLVDGGVDSLMRGNEAQIGTALEDGISLAAVDALPDIPLRMLACLGFGTEEDVSHAHVLENIAALTQAGAFLGVCALVGRMESVRAYEEAVAYAHERRGQDPSVVNSSIVAAVQGHYGDYHATEKTHGSRLTLSPLMPLYWFFDLPAVAGRNLFLPELRHGDTRRDGLAALARMRNLVPRRPDPRPPFRP